MRNDSVTPVRNRNMAEGIPPRKSETRNTFVPRKSRRSSEWKACPWSMITAARPRVQSRNCRRFAFLRGFMRNGNLLLRRNSLGVLGHFELHVRVRDRRIHLHVGIGDQHVVAGALGELLLNR